MAFYDLLSTFDYIEPNNLKGLQPGFVVAQMPVAETASALVKNVNGVKFMENGTICAISAQGIVAPTAETKNLFICYSEPLNTMFNENKFYAVNLKEEYPRLVQLIPGDEWMATKELTLSGDLAGRIVEITTETGVGKSDDWFACGTMADGTVGHHYMFIG